MTAESASPGAGTGIRTRLAVVALASVWALTLIALAGLAAWLELTYTPPAADEIQAPDRTASETTSAEAEATTRITDPPPAASSGSGDAAQAPTEASASPEEQGSAGPQATASQPEGRAAEIRLAAAPAPDLVESAGGGLLLPIAGPAGRAPWKEYSRPYLGDPDAPKIALVIQGIGLDAERDRAAIEQLPPEVTLAISPYAQAPQELSGRAREAGHEVLLMVPMEPLEYPANDPGPLTLLAEMPQDELIDRLHRVLGRFQGYVGVVNHMGSRFTSERPALDPVMNDMARRGLLWLDARTTAESVLPEAAQAAGLPVAVNDRYIDNEASAATIDELLARLLRIARLEGAAVGIGRPYPVTLQRIAAFARTLEDSPAALAPVSAVAGIRPDDAQAPAR